MKMEKNINNKSKSFFNMELKRLWFMITLLFFSIMSVNALTQTTISSCPVSLVNDTEYIISSNFVVSSSPCFNFNGGKNNIIVNGNNTPLTISFYTQFSGTNTNVTIKNLDVTSYYNLIQNGAIVNSLNIQNNKVKDLASTFIQIPNLQSATFNNLYIDSNYIRSTNGVNFMHVPRGSFTITNFTLTNNELSGFSNLLIAPTNINQNSNIQFFGIVDWNNNIMSYNGLLFSTTDGNAFTDDNTITYDSCTGKSFTGNYDAKISLTDSNGDFVSDSNYLYATSGCAVVYSGTMPTKANSYFNANEIYFSRPFVNPTQYESNKRYMVGTTSLTLNSTEVINLQNVQNVIIDLSLWENQNVYTITSATNVIRLGTSNKLYGGLDLVNKPVIQTSGTMSIADAGLYGNNWQLITYDNKPTIENIRFNLNAVDNYGLLRKTNSGVDGIDVVFKNNYFDMNYVPATATRPQILVGAFSTIEGNTFDLPSSKNVSLIGGGTSSGVGGGHKVTSNIFNGGGYVFIALADAIGGGAVNYKNKFIHNKFDKVSSTYAYPFHPTDDVQNLLLSSNTELNGSYYYTLGCDNYQFNIGNYYRDFADAGFYNDSDGDGVHNSYAGVNYIHRGDDYTNVPYRDYRSIISYPYNFAGQTGNAVNVVNTCLSFNYNVVTPTNATTSGNFNSNWEFTSSGYPNMYCEETINGIKVIYSNVTSGQNKGMAWSLGTGGASFQVKCCDTSSCDNIVKTSDLVNFCVGSCSGIAPIIDINPIVAVLGCTDSLATNYNPLATQDDGSCTYGTGGGGSGNNSQSYTTSGVVITSNSATTGDNAVSFVGDIVNGIIQVATPVGVFMFIMLIIIALFVFLGA